MTEQLNISDWENVVVNLRKVNTKYKEFLIRYRELIINHKPYVNSLENMVKDTNVSMDIFKMKKVEHISFDLWRTNWESTVRFSQVLNIAISKAIRGDGVDLYNLFNKDLCKLFGINEFKYNEGYPSYDNLVIARDPKFETSLIGEIKEIKDWDVHKWINCKNYILRMFDMGNMSYWDDVMTIIENTCKYILLNAKKNSNDLNLFDRLYTTLFIVEFSGILFNVFQTLLQHWIRIGVTLVISK